jgi:hypothetical protein
MTSKRKVYAEAGTYIGADVPDFMRKVVLAIIAVTENWDEAKCREYDLTEADLEDARAPFKIRVGDA